MRCFQPSCDWASWTSAYKYLKYYDADSAKNIGSRSPANYVSKPKTVKPKVCKLPDGFKPITTGSGMFATQARKYLESRSFDIDQLSKEYNVGYVDAGASKWFCYLIFPYTDEQGKLCYWQGRDFSDGRANNQRWKNPEDGETPVNKSDILYNQKQILSSEELWVCEGITDTITMGNAIGVSGKSLSATQIDLIQNSLSDVVIIAFDAGAWLDSLNSSKAILHGLKYEKRVFAVDVPIDKSGNEWKKDANGYGRERMMAFDRIEMTEAVIYQERLMIRVDGPLTFRGKSGVLDFS